MPNNNVFTNVQGGGIDGVNAGVGIDSINVLNNTTLGIGKKLNDKDKSKYKRTIKPDGTIIEEIKIDKTNKKRDLFDLGTDGINIGEIGVKAGVGEKALEDTVSFVDSIWGSKQTSNKTQDARIEKMKLEEMKLQEFKNARQEQLNQDSLIRKMNEENILQETNVRGLK